jgi:xanthine dehydrogenase small subunit
MAQNGHCFAAAMFLNAKAFALGAGADRASHRHRWFNSAVVHSLVGPFMRDYVLIYVNGQRHKLRGAAVFQSLSTYLRLTLGLTGTKVVCAEGDCGSCSVLIGRPRNGSIEYSTVCSCILYLFQLDACHVITVEGLSRGDELSPVQQALVDARGTQCGFCTPGFVVAIHGMVESGVPLTEERIRRGLVGNLCRCTGYEPILRAGLSVDAGRVPPLNQLYDSPELHAELAQADSEAVRVESGGQRFFKPTTVAEATGFKAANADCVIVSGGTDIGVQINKGLRALGSVMSLSAVPELRELDVDSGSIVAGATLPVSALEKAASSTLPEYAVLLDRFGSPQIRNAATLGGNIANGSPIGDTMPALFVLNAEIELTAPHTRRRVNINQFYRGYKQTVAAPEELISRVFIPLPGAGESLKLYKISKRKDLDISAFSAAFWMKLSGGRIDDVRIAYGGVGPQVLRLPRTEAFLKGKDLTQELFDSARAVVLAEIAPISDVRGTAAYRNRLAANILGKLYFDLLAGQEKQRSAAAGAGEHGND